MTTEQRQGPHESPFDAQFFVLRTPLLPIEELLSWSAGLATRGLWEAGAELETIELAWHADLERLRAFLLELVARPEINHALFIASPSLESGLGHWKSNPGSKKGRQAERALVRYFERMCVRATPFGLFAGCSVGRVDCLDSKGQSIFNLLPREEYCLSSRLDFDYLFALTRGFQDDANLARQLRYLPNSSLHRYGDVWHYVESRVAASGRSHHLVKVENDQYLEAVIERAREGAGVADLVQRLVMVATDLDVTSEDADIYVRELIDNGVLVSSLSPLVTGESALDDIIDQVEAFETRQGADVVLRWARERLAGINQRGLGAAPDDYRAVASRLESLPAKVDISKLYQVDMIKPVQRVLLARPVVDELMKGVEVLRRLNGAPEVDPLSQFREAFSARYEKASVPLIEALDEELGVGFGQPRQDGSPLVRGLRFASENKTQTTVPRSHALLLRKIIEAAREGTVEVSLDLDELPGDDDLIPPLPDSFDVIATLSAPAVPADNEDFELWLHHGGGPDGARLLGRFCHADPELCARVRGYLRQEEAHQPEVIYAEIVHLPEGRIGNVLCRPVLREYELTYLGRSGAPSDRQIPATDLLVSVVGRDIILHSRQLGKRIVPRLTNAHGFLNLQLAPLYRFLCQLQHQHTSGVPSFQWGPLDSLDFLPRVRCGKVILAPARWQVSREEIDSLGQVEGYRRFLLVQELRRRRNLPRWVVLVESDHYLPTDLDNPLSVDAFVHAAKRGLRAKLQELYPAPDRLCVTGPEGRFYHELDIPFSRRPRKGTNSAGSPIQRDPIQSTAVHRKTRLLPLGSDWLYVKLYAGTATLDDILTTAVPPVIERGLATGVFSRWFFLRYADPQPHLRLRFNGNPDRLAQQFLPLILNQFNPLLDSGRIWKIQFDTYDREVERYGGLEAAIAAEDIFFADSDAALAILQAVPGEDLDTRWQVALLGAHTLLGDCGLDLGARHQLVRGLRDSFHREFQVGIIQKRELGDRFRAERRRLENLIDLSTEPTEILGLARKLFERRSARVVEAVNRLRRIAELGQLRSGIPELATSYVHTHVNRIIRSAARNHEAILYDFLFRLYDGQLARETKAQSPIKHVSSELQ